MAVASSFEQRRIAAQLRTAGMSWADIATVLRERYGLGGLAAARQAHAWTQQRAVDEWNGRWPDDRIEQKDLSRWECWPVSRSGVMPRLCTIDRLAELYSLSASDLVAGWADYRSEGLPERSSARYGGGVDRRSFLGVVAGAGVASALPAAAKGSRIGRGDIERLEQDAWALWLADEDQGGGAVHGLALGLASQVRGLLDDGKYSETIGRDLQRLHGQTLELAAWTAFDAGDQDRARTLFERALTAAQLGEDPGLAAWILAQMSLQATLFGSAREAVDFAQLAQRVARPVSTDLLLSALAGREALGHARRGDARACTDALRRAEALHDDLRPGTDAAWLQCWTPGEVRQVVAQAHLFLRLPTAADQAAQESLRFGGAYSRPQARYLACRADTLLAVGEVDEAAAVVTKTAPLLRTVSSERVRGRLLAMRPTLERHSAVPGVPEALHALATS